MIFVQTFRAVTGPGPNNGRSFISGGLTLAVLVLPIVVLVLGDQRYEGGFRGGKRNGYGQVTSADGKVQSGRWEDGKPIETAP